MTRSSRFIQPEWPADRLDPGAPTGLILGGMGGPDRAEDVEPFLKNLFADPAVLPLPGWLGRSVGAWIVKRRAGKVRERYRRIGHGGGSPQLDWTQRQAAHLADLLNRDGLDITPACAMRYWQPTSETTIHELHAAGIRQLLVIPTYPQYSAATSGSILTAVQETARHVVPEMPLHVVPCWHDLDGYIDAITELAVAEVKRWTTADLDPRSCGLLYVAHSLPRRFVDRGDPYLAQTRQTVTTIHQRLLKRNTTHESWFRGLPGSGQPVLAFQSKVGPVKWVGPELSRTVEQLAAAGCRNLVVVPVSFTCEHIETEYELDIELAELAGRSGVSEFRRTPALNLHPVWLESLARHLAATAFGDHTATDQSGQELHNES